MGPDATGKLSSIDTTSPGSTSPVNVAPIPSSPSSVDRPHSEADPPGRNTSTDNRMSAGWRRYRRGLGNVAFELGV